MQTRPPLHSASLAVPLLSSEPAKILHIVMPCHSPHTESPFRASMQPVKLILCQVKPVNLIFTLPSILLLPSTDTRSAHHLEKTSRHHQEYVFMLLFSASDFPLLSNFLSIHFALFSFLFRLWDKP